MMIGGCLCYALCMIDDKRWEELHSHIDRLREKKAYITLDHTTITRYVVINGGADSEKFIRIPFEVWLHMMSNDPYTSEEGWCDLLSLVVEELGH
jgi:hypothetical protein